jgi:GH24 family phage-related lysozyme (muramidase)
VLKINKEALSLIKEREGLRLNPYYCSGSVLTVGYGHAILKDDKIDGLIITEDKNKILHASGKISVETANNLFLKDVERFEKGVFQLLKSKTTENQFSAMVSFAFNIGLVNFKNSTLLNLHNQAKYLEASLEFPKWNKVTKKGIKKVEAGLVIRRAMEKNLYMKG